MLGSRHDHHGVADGNIKSFVRQHHPATASGDVIKLFGRFMMMQKRGCTRLDDSFGKALAARTYAACCAGCMNSRMVEPSLVMKAGKAW